MIYWMLRIRIGFLQNFHRSMRRALLSFASTCIIFAFTHYSACFRWMEEELWEWEVKSVDVYLWLREQDLNLQPSGYGLLVCFALRFDFAKELCRKAFNHPLAQSIASGVFIFQSVFICNHSSKVCVSPLLFSDISSVALRVVDASTIFGRKQFSKKLQHFDQKKQYPH